MERIAQVLARQIADRCAARTSTQGDAPLIIELAIEPGIGAEGFKIADSASKTVRIIGNDELQRWSKPAKTPRSIRGIVRSHDASAKLKPILQKGDRFRLLGLWKIQSWRYGAIV